jgi:hypothetical protein
MRTSQASQPYPRIVSETNSTLGLEFTLALNSTIIHSGQAVNITAYVTNIRSVLNNMTAADDWSPYWLRWEWQRGYSCPYLSTNAQVIRGYYTSSNITTLPAFYSNGTSFILQLAKFPPLHGCHAPFGMWQAFFPLQPGQIHVDYYYAAMGYYPVDTSDPSGEKFLGFRPLEAGVYTVAAGDEWGQSVIAHFQVLP